MPTVSTPSDAVPAGGNRGPDTPSGQGPLSWTRGRFSDGRGAASRPVDVAIDRDQNQLVIRRTDGTVETAWQLNRVETGEPLGKASVDVLIHEPGRAGATLFVGDPGFVKQLGAAAPHVTSAGRRWKTATPFLIVAACLAALVGILAAIEFSPARALASMVPRDTRAALGRQVMLAVGGAVETCNAPDGMAALQRLTDKLSAAAGPGRKFEVRVARSNVVNAFAAPGEQIVIMNGLLKQAASADEVAGVLAHEMGHGIELHPEAGIIRTVGLAVAAEMILGGSGGGNIGSIGVALANLGYTRAAEREADAHALAILKAASISPEGIAAFFERMDRSERARPAGTGRNRDANDKQSETGKGEANKPSEFPGSELLRTHPANSERLASIRSAIGKYPTVPAMDAADWEALKSICGDPARTGTDQIPPSRQGPPTRPSDRTGREI